MNSNFIVIAINSIELYNILQEAIDKYEIKLHEKKDLQIKFIEAWKSIEIVEDIKNKSGNEKGREAECLLKKLKSSKSLSIFQ